MFVPYWTEITVDKILRYNADKLFHHFDVHVSEGLRHNQETQEKRKAIWQPAGNLWVWTYKAIQKGLTQTNPLLQNLLI